jgi:hypothetical protein
MRVEILQELGPDDPRLEIPWASGDEPTLAYMNLKTFPEKVEELDECKDRAVLANLLRAINRPDSPLGSAKCHVWITHELAEEERWDFDFPVKVASYLDLLFESPDLNSDLGHHLRLAEEIERGMKETRLPAQMDIAVRRCLFHAEENWGYYLTLFVHAYGASENEAEKVWTLALLTLREVLAGLTRVSWKSASRWEGTANSSGAARRICPSPLPIP